jgi:tetratricopeptide (TPR) repeat protein
MAGALTAVWASPLLANPSTVSEGRRRLGRALELDPSPTLARAKALDAAAEMAHFSEDNAAVRASAEEALEIHRQLGDGPGTADSMASLAVALGEGGDWVAARPLFEESLERFRDLGDEARVMWGTRSLAWAYAELGDLAGARPLYEEALRLARAAGNRLFESVVLGSLAWLALADGRVRESPALLSEALRLQVDLGDQVELGVNLCHAAQILAAVGRAETAARLIASFDALAEELGGSYPWVTRMNEETLRDIRTQLEPAAFEAAREKGAKLASGGAVAVALDALDEVG